MTRNERGSVTLIVAASLAFAAIIAAFGADVTRAIGARGRAQAAADAAALAAAQELIVSSGRPLEEVAAEYAKRGGARLEACDCDPSADQVIVSVALDVTLPLLGQIRTVRAKARAVVEAPSGTRGLQAWFVARLACLFGRVPGIEVVSGFRTRVEQARLHAERPDLAAPPESSMHERGLAADLAFPSDLARSAAHSMAAGCGLEFPVQGEPWHVEPAARGPPSGDMSSRIRVRKALNADLIPMGSSVRGEISPPLSALQHEEGDTMRRLTTLASTALLLAALIPIAAQAARPECLGSSPTIRGTYGNDTIYGTNYRDVISALGGADSVHALAGDDRVCGDLGADVIYDGYGLDVVDGGDGVDTLYLCPDGASDRLMNVERVFQTSLGCR